MSNHCCGTSSVAATPTSPAPYEAATDASLAGDGVPVNGPVDGSTGVDDTSFPVDASVDVPASSGTTSSIAPTVPSTGFDSEPVDDPTTDPSSAINQARRQQRALGTTGSDYPTGFDQAQDAASPYGAAGGADPIIATDPTTGAPILDPSTGQPIWVDPTTGYPVPVDPATGRPTPNAEPGTGTTDPTGGIGGTPTSGAAPTIEELQTRFSPYGVTPEQVQQIADAGFTPEELDQLEQQLQAQTGLSPDGSPAATGWSAEWAKKFGDLFEAAGVPRKQAVANLEKAGLTAQQLEATYQYLQTPDGQAELAQLAEQAKQQAQQNGGSGGGGGIGSLAFKGLALAAGGYLAWRIVKRKVAGKLAEEAAKATGQGAVRAAEKLATMKGSAAEAARLEALKGLEGKAGESAEAARRALTTGASDAAKGVSELGATGVADVGARSLSTSTARQLLLDRAESKGISAVTRDVFGRPIPGGGAPIGTAGADLVYGELAHRGTLTMSMRQQLARELNLPGRDALYHHVEAADLKVWDQKIAQGLKTQEAQRAAALGGPEATAASERAATTYREGATAGDSGASQAGDTARPTASEHAAASTSAVSDTVASTRGAAIAAASAGRSTQEIMAVARSGISRWRHPIEYMRVGAEAAKLGPAAQAMEGASTLGRISKVGGAFGAEMHAMGGITGAVKAGTDLLRGKGGIFMAGIDLALDGAPKVMATMHAEGHWGKETSKAAGGAVGHAVGNVVGFGIGAHVGVAAGAAIGTAILPGVGTAIGAGVGWLAGGFVGSIIGSNLLGKAGSVIGGAVHGVIEGIGNLFS